MRGRSQDAAGEAERLHLFRGRRHEAVGHLSGPLRIYPTRIRAEEGDCSLDHGRAGRVVIAPPLLPLSSLLSSPSPLSVHYSCRCFFGSIRMSSPLFLSQLVGVPLEIMHPTAEKDTTHTKIFVGGLPYHTNDASLRKYFEAFGDIDEAVVITDKQTGKSRGYGFVSSPLTCFFCFLLLLLTSFCHLSEVVDDRTVARTVRDQEVMRTNQLAERNPRVRWKVRAVGLQLIYSTLPPAEDSPVVSVGPSVGHMLGA